MSTRAIKFAGTHLEVDLIRKASTSTSARSGASTQKSRRFHSFEHEVYFLPNDDAEHDRLELQNRIWSLTLHGGIHISPIQPNIKHVLDIGTGTGVWALDFAKAHPHSRVLGTDLTPVATIKNQPSNVSFAVANANQPWEFEGQMFDFVHSRMLLLGVPDWKHYFTQAFEHTKPGGWVEVQEPRFPTGYVEDGAAADATAMKRWAKHLDDATSKIGVSLQACDDFEKILKTLGFINIHIQRLNWPVGPWPKDPRDKEIGRLMAINMKEGLVPVLGSKLLGGVLGWTDEQIQKSVQQLNDDFDDPSTQYSIEIVLCSAQKPL